MTMFVSNGKSDEDGYQETIDSLKDELAACEKELADLKSHDHAPCVLCDPLRQQLAASEKEANKWFVLHQALEKEVERLMGELSNRPFTSEMAALRNEVTRLEQSVSELTVASQCVVCCGAGDSGTGNLCICGGTGKATEAFTNLNIEYHQLQTVLEECEGMLRRARPWAHLDLIADIDAYFDQRKP